MTIDDWVNCCMCVIVTVFAGLAVCLLIGVAVGLIFTFIQAFGGC